MIRRDLAATPFRPITDEWLQAAYQSPDKRTEQHWQILLLSENLIDELIAADIVVGSPMYNYTVPASPKAWIDQIVRPALGVREGISVEELEAARKLESNDPRIAQALRFAKRMLDGQVEPSDVASLQQAGYSDEEIVEIIGVIVLNVFRNYFNLAAQTEVDFPLVRVAEIAALRGS